MIEEIIGSNKFTLFINDIPYVEKLDQHVQRDDELEIAVPEDVEFKFDPLNGF